MKKILLIAAAAITLVACNKPTLKEQYTTLTQETDAALDTMTDMTAFEALLDSYIAQVMDMYLGNMQDEYADSVLFDVYYLLDTNQKTKIFDAMSKEKLASEGIKDLYDNYRIEQITAVGNQYTDIAALQADGTPLALSELVGKTEYVLVDFWASWCRPCRNLLPVLKEIYEAQPAGKLQILGISCDRDSAAWQKAVAEEELPWLQIRDQRQDPYNPCDVYGIMAIPSTFLIDANGIIVARNPSEDEIKEILAK